MSDWPFPDYDHWVRRARPKRVVDGDTIDLTIDLGFNTYIDGAGARIRLAGVDTAEVYGVKKTSDEYQLGKEQGDFVRVWLDHADDGREWPLLVKTEKHAGKYGRYIGVIWRQVDEHCLNEAIIEAYPETAYEP